jgi:hypothetical protein
MNDCVTNVVKIKHHGREIHGVSYLPDARGKVSCCYL